MMKNKLLIVLMLALFQFTNAQEKDSTIVVKDTIYTEGVEVVKDTIETEPKITLHWEESFYKAQKKAKKQGKKILLFFTGSDWCGPCKALEEDVLHTNKFKELTKNTILYKADFPRATDLVSKKQQKENNKLKRKYHISSYPVIVIINQYGHIIAQKKSYSLMRDPSYHFSFLEQNLK